MAMSLRDQLLQAGLANERQAREVERQLTQQQRQLQQRPKGKRDTPLPAQLAAQQAQLAKVARDRELSRQVTLHADKKAIHAQIAQLIEQNRLPRAQTDERYHFVDGNKVRHIPADRSLRERLGRGDIAIVRRNGGYELVPAETAHRIRERDASAVVDCRGAQGAAGDDGVPEDLMW